MERYILESEQKALNINLDESIYGTFAEIGAGQEVARYFFQAGGAAGTVAKTMSAYDKTYSDEIYGHEDTGRYVCESRLNKMLDHEYKLLINRLGKERADTRFFAFADTVSAINYTKTISGDGWLGIRYQPEIGAPIHDIILHVQMLDLDNKLQQQAVGILGVNLIFAAYFLNSEIELFLLSLLDRLKDRVMIDLIRLQGPLFKALNPCSLTFKLVQLGLSDVAMIGKDGLAFHPSQKLYKKNILLIRGAFNPITWMTYDIVNFGHKQFISTLGENTPETEILAEMTLDILANKGKLDENDFIERTLTLNHIGLPVCITKGGNQQLIIKYLDQFKCNQIGLCLTAGYAARFFDEIKAKYANKHLLTGLGELFNGKVKMLVYPSVIPKVKTFMKIKDIVFDHFMKFLIKHLIFTEQLMDIVDFDPKNLGISTTEVRKKIQKGDHTWRDSVPEKAANFIEKNDFFN